MRLVVKAQAASFAARVTATAGGARAMVKAEVQATYRQGDIPIASPTVLGGVKIGDNLNITADGALSVATASAVEADNTKPVTSAAVHTEVGNIEVLRDRPLTVEERVEDLEQRAKTWKPGEKVYQEGDPENDYGPADERYYNGTWYFCRQTHTTQADWTPDITPALWQKEEKL